MQQQLVAEQDVEEQQMDMQLDVVIHGNDGPPLQHAGG